MYITRDVHSIKIKLKFRINYTSVLFFTFRLIGFFKKKKKRNMTF